MFSDTDSQTYRQNILPRAMCINACCFRCIAQADT